MSKITTPEMAIAAIPDGAHMAVCGFRWAGNPELLLRTLGNRFRATGRPRGLTLIFSSAQGDTAGTGLDHIAERDLLARVIGGFWGLSAPLARLAQQNEIEAYNLPQGQICRLYSAIAAGMPGLLSHVGLGTYIDPRQRGGRLNDVTTVPLVEIVVIQGREWLLYKAIPIHVGLIRGTTADESGNISVEREAVSTEALALAFAVHNSGGRVIAQVERVVPNCGIHPRDVAVPGHVVDAVVLTSEPDTDHRQCVQSVYSPVFSGDDRASQSGPALATPLLRKIVATRAIRELRNGDVVNLGQGIPTDIAALLRDHIDAPSVTFTIESGVVGGRPLPPPDFGIAANPQAILRQDDQFTFYNGGGLDVAFLGFAEIDLSGSVNVSRFGGRLVGCGGFMDIAQPAKRLVFCGSLTTGGLELGIEGGRLHIVREGRTRKFVRRVEEITFNASDALRDGRSIKYITDRCVLSLTPEGLRLDEVAPGVDVRQQIIEQVEFPLLVATPLKQMRLPGALG